MEDEVEEYFRNVRENAKIKYSGINFSTKSDDELISLSNNFKNLPLIRDLCRSLYLEIQKRGLLDIIKKNLKNKVFNSYVEEIKKFIQDNNLEEVKDLIRTNRTYYNFVIDHKIPYEDLGLKRKDTNPNGMWTNYENVYNAAKECRSKREFERKYNGAYCAAYRYGWMKDFTWFPDYTDMGNNYIIYAYIHKPKMVAYIGLTQNEDERHETHSTGMYQNRESYSAVYNYFSSIGIDVPKPKILYTNLTAKEAQTKEREMMEKYALDGWVMLNKAKGGGLGHCVYWTKQNVFKVAKECKGRHDLDKKYPGAYNRALKDGYLDEIFPPKKPIVWDLDKLKDFAAGCRTYRDLERKYATPAKWMRDNGLSKELYPKINWDKRLKDIISKYDSVEELKRDNWAAWNQAYCRGLL